MTANWIALCALGIWPLVAFILYSRSSALNATIWTLLGGELLLPFGAEIKFQGIPQFDKASIPVLVAVAGCLVAKKIRFRIGRPGVLGLLTAMYIIGPSITAWLNQDPIPLANKVLPGETAYDALSATFVQCIAIAPFFLGRNLVQSALDVEKILMSVAVAGLFYSAPMLFEIRMSPQLNFWIYGYYASDFLQQMRDGGFRPSVFLGHGLLAAFFMMTSTVSAAALWRAKRPAWNLPPGKLTVFLFVVLAFCKTLGAFIYAIVAVPAIRFLSTAAQTRIAVLLTSVALLYPLARDLNYIPTGTLVEAANSISVDRAQSLQTRFQNEDGLLARASERWAFGWGRWGRNRVFTADSGKDDSITDGRWIITFGQYGVFGFVAEFGLLALPVFRSWLLLTRIQVGRSRLYVSALALILALNIFDLLPNSGLLPWTWLTAGALLGASEALARRRLASGIGGLAREPFRSKPQALPRAQIR